MKSRKTLASLLAIGVFILAFQSTIVSASTQVCLALTNPPSFVGSGPITLKLGFMDYGNGHFSLAGTEQFTLTTNPPITVVNPLHGNAEVIGNKVEVSLNGTSISGSILNNTSIHVEIDLATLNGIFVTDIASQEGTAAVVQCPQ